MKYEHTIIDRLAKQQQMADEMVSQRIKDREAIRALKKKRREKKEKRKMYAERRNQLKERNQG